jgi:hypothetical protein
MTVLVDEVYGRGMMSHNKTARAEIDDSARKAERRIRTATGEINVEKVKLAFALRMAAKRHPVASKG